MTIYLINLLITYIYICGIITTWFNYNFPPKIKLNAKNKYLYLFLVNPYPYIYTYMTMNDYNQHRYMSISFKASTYLSVQ